MVGFRQDRIDGFLQNLRIALAPAVNQIRITLNDSNGCPQLMGRIGNKLMNLGENESVASIAKVRELGDKDTETEGETGEPSEEGAEEALETDAELLNEDNENEEDEIARMLEERGEEDGENPEE